MPKFLKQYQEKVGLAPGTLVHIGTGKSESVKVTLIEYDENHFEESTIENIEEYMPFSDKPGIKWLDVDSVHQIELIESFGNQFGIHPLTLADIVNTKHRPKMEDYGEYIYIVLKMIDYDEKNKSLLVEQVSVVFGNNFVITFQEHEGDLFDPIRERLRNGVGKIRNYGADYLAYSLMDTIVDNYFVILEKVGEDIEDIEEELLNNPSQDTLRKIHDLKREMIFLRRSVWPLREITGLMQRGETKLINDSTQIYLKDIYDHTIQVIDSIEAARDMLSSMMDVYLSSVSNKMNNIMKVLTIIATIFMPLTFIAGVYGMNFENMPELKWSWGYPAVLLLMFFISITMFIFFWKKKWL
jgi:magnesium transporter